MIAEYNHQRFNCPCRLSQSLCNVRCQNILYKAVFEHFIEIKDITVLLLASKSFQNSSFGANFLVTFVVDVDTVLLMNSVLSPSSCLPMQFVPSLHIKHLWSFSQEINRGLSNIVGNIVNTKYFSSSLRSLTLDSAHHEIVSCFFGSSSNNAWPQLQDLTVKNCELNDSVLEIISKNAIQLRTLNFSRSLGITDAGLEHISTISSITSLDLYGCGLITDVGLAFISTKLSNISSLDLGGCTKITDSGLAYVSQLLSITSLDLSWCNLITHAAIDQFKAATPNCDLVGMEE